MTFRSSTPWLGVAAMALTLACSGPNDTFPQVTSRGGPIMAHPQIVTITFADDPDRAALEAHARWLVSSTWLTAVGVDYGVGVGSVLGVGERAEVAPAQLTNDDVAALIAQWLGDGSLPRPADGNLKSVLYVMHLPGSSTLSFGTGPRASTSCTDFRGYHSSARRSGFEFAYATEVRCRVGSPAVTLLEQREGTTSHEFIEAATDPFPSTNAGIRLADLSSSYAMLGGEVGDLCQIGGGVDLFREGNFVAQRSWSAANAQSLDGDPCVPVLPEVYYNMRATPSARQRAVAGDVLHYTLTGWATNPVDDWQVIPIANGSIQPTVAVSSSMANVNRSLELTVTIPTTAIVGDYARVFVFSGRSSADLRMIPLLISVGPPCSERTTCDACINSAGCGWCSGTSRCESVGSNGSRESACNGTNWAATPGACSGTCALHAGNCAECVAVVGCGWCASGSSGQCLPAQRNGSGSEDGACSGDAWSAIATYCP